MPGITMRIDLRQHDETGGPPVAEPEAARRLVLALRDRLQAAAE